MSNSKKKEKAKVLSVVFEISTTASGLTLLSSKTVGGKKYLGADVAGKDLSGAIDRIPGMLRIFFNDLFRSEPIVEIVENDAHTISIKALESVESAL